MLAFSVSLIHIGEGKVFPVYTMKAYWGNTSTAPPVSNPGVRCRWVGNFKALPLFPGKNPCTWATDLIWTFLRQVLGANPPSCTVGTGSVARVEWLGRHIHHPHPSSAEVKKGVELYLYSPSESSWPVIGQTLPLTLNYSSFLRKSVYILNVHIMQLTVRPEGTLMFFGCST
jgi:hypothetical protein